mgnify:CR=1 FL=1
MKIRKMKSNLDERQELKLLKIGCIYESCLLSFGCMYPKWNLGQEIETEFQDECHSQ